MENHFLLKILLPEMSSAHLRLEAAWGGIHQDTPETPRGLDRWELEKHHCPCHTSRVLGSQAAGKGRADALADSGGHVFSGFGCKLVYCFLVRLLEMD